MIGDWALGKELLPMPIAQLPIPKYELFVV
jgi:hypothetical protein